MRSRQGKSAPVVGGATNRERITARPKVKHVMIAGRIITLLLFVALRTRIQRKKLRWWKREKQVVKRRNLTP